MNIKEVKKLYVDELWSLRRIADHFNTNHHMIKRMLIAGGVAIDNKSRRFPKPITEERKKQISDQSKGRKAWNKGIRANEQQIRRYIKARMRTSIDLDIYADINKLQLLIRFTSKHLKHIGFNDDARKAFLDKFYFDEQFNRIYDKWQETGENKWYFPSLDHKVSKFNGENWSLDNLQFLTWFENRAKAEMNQDEWEKFKLETNTKSDLFYI